MLGGESLFSPGPLMMTDHCRRGMTLTSMNTAPRTVNDPLYNLPSGKNNDLGTPNTGYSPQDSNFISGVTNGAGANAPSEKLGFYFGGYYNQNGTKYDYFNPPTDEANFLIKVDMSEVTNADWSVMTPQNTSACPWRAEGGLVWIPASTQGLLIAVGGVETPADLNYYVGEDNTTVSMSFLTEFPVYDIGTDTWSLQPLNPNSPVPPHPLAQFCTVVASAANGTHHEIFVYGGWDNDKGDPVSDVWILTVPSFTWIKADGAGQNGAPRQGHVCVSPYPNQMIAIGGTAKAGMSLSTNRTVDVYDLNELNWTSSYDPDVYDEYKAHQTVLQVVSATPTASGMSSQVANWFDTQYDMSKVKFYGPYTKEGTSTPSPNNTTAPNNTSTSSAAPTSAPSHNSDRAWVIPVAVVVPVVSVLALIGALLLFCRRWRTRQTRSPSQGTSELHRRKSWVVPWLWSTGSETGRKDIGSDTMTEVEPAQSPPIKAGPQELEGGARGDYFSGNGVNQSPHDKWVTTTPARSPHGEYNGLVEAPHSVTVHEVDGGSHFGGDGGNSRLPGSTSMSQPDVSSNPSGSPGITPAETPSLSRGPSATAPANERSHQPWASMGRVIGVFPLIGSGPEETRSHRHTASVSSGPSLPSPGLDAGPRPVRSRSRSVGEDGPASDGRDTGNHTL